MPVSEFNLITLPEWYRNERETGRIIEKLQSVKELDYYLRNPDEYIRRLAILRLQKLTDKDCVNFLRELIDDPIESEENKYLAAWILKKLIKKRIGDNFLSNRYLDSFDGSESFEELFIIEQDDLYPAIEFDFTSSQSYSDIQLDSKEIVLERDAFFESDFDLKKWFSTFWSRLMKNSLSILCKVPAFIIKLPVHIGRSAMAFFKKQSDKRQSEKKQSDRKHSTQLNMEIINPDIINTEMINPKIRNREISNPKIKYSKANHLKIRRKNEGRNIKMNMFFDFTKKCLFYIFYILFFPIRFANKHKLAIICSLLAVYSLLAFTDYGRAITNKYWDIDLKEVQNSTIQKAKDYYTYALSEFNKLTGINEWKQAESDNQLKLSNINNTDPSNSTPENRVQYSVIAQKGLNIRELADATSKKVGDNSIAFGSVVIFLSESKTDDSGTTWYYVESKDGRIGWVAAKYLKEKKEG